MTCKHTTRKTLALVDELQEAGAYEEAEKELSALIQSTEGSEQIEGNIRFGELLCSRDGPQAAIRFFSEMLEEYPENTRGLYHRADLYHRQHCRSRCLTDLNRCLDLQPSSTKARRLLLTCYIEEYDFTLEGKKDPLYRHLHDGSWNERLFRKLPENEPGRLQRAKLLLELGGGAMEWTSDGLLAAAEAAERGGRMDFLMELIPWLAGVDGGCHVERWGTWFLLRQDYERAYRCFCLLGKGSEEPKHGCGIWTVGKHYIDSFCMRHIGKHCSDDQEKDFHGVFNIGMEEIRRLIPQMEDAPVVRCDDFLYYTISYPGVGYQGGRSGDRHILDWVIVVVELKTNRIVTIYPGDRERLEQGVTR